MSRTFKIFGVGVVVMLFLLVGELIMAYAKDVRETHAAMPRVIQPEALRGLPSGAIELHFGRYLKYVERAGNVYAGVVIRKMPGRDICEQKRPGYYHEMAHDLLVLQDESRRWADEKQEEKDGNIVVIFRLMTPREAEEAEKAKKEMSKSLVDTIVDN